MSINDEGGYGQEFGGHGKGVSGMAINPFRSSVIPAKARLSGGHGDKLSPARYLAQSATRRLLSLPKHCNNSLRFKPFLSPVYGAAVKRDIKEMEQKLTIKLGALLVIGVTVMTVLDKLL